MTEPEHDTTGAGDVPRGTEPAPAAVEQPHGRRRRKDRTLRVAPVHARVRGPILNVVDLSKLTALAGELRERAPKDHRDGRAWYRVHNAADGDRTEVFIYDMIGAWGVTAQDFVTDLRAITTPAIDLHLNSEGGEVFDGVAIYAALCNHPAHVTVHVDSLAASAASFIAQAGDTRIMGRNARMMIHEAHAAMFGTAEDAHALATLLDDTSQNIASIYADRAGGTVKQWRAAMKAETWYTAEKAVAAGLADEVAPAPVTRGDNRVSSGPNNREPDSPAPPFVFDPDMFRSAVKEAVGCPTSA